MTNKFWTIQNGVLGTAHINREGNVVDFKEGKVIPRSHHWNKNRLLSVVSNDGFNLKIEIEFKVLKSCLDLKDWNQQFSGKAKAIKIALIFEGKETSAFDCQFWEIDDPNTSLEDSEALKKALKERLEKEAKEFALIAEKEANLADKFERDFDFSLLSRQQKKWVKSFIESNGAKAEQQVEEFIKSRKGGSKWWSLNRKNVVQELRSLISVAA